MKLAEVLHLCQFCVMIFVVMDMPRKAKKKTHRMPPLSFLDKLIYWLAFALLCVGYFALSFGVLWLRNKITFADEAVVAAEDNISILWSLVTWMTFFLMTFILWLQPYQDRRPIFGKRNFKYGPPAWPKVYPLFMKNKPYVFVSEREKKNRKKIASILLIILLVSFIPLPWSLYGRDCLRNDGSIVQYNMFNRQVYDFSSGEIEEITIETYRHRPKGGSTYWAVRMRFVTKTEKEYTFEQREFRNDIQGELKNWLVTMVNLKRRYNPDIFRYNDVEKLDLVMKTQDFTQEEIELLYQLFGQ